MALLFAVWASPAPGRHIALLPAGRLLRLALAVCYAQGRRLAQALPWAEKMLALDPADAHAKQLLDKLRHSP